MDQQQNISSKMVFTDGTVNATYLLASNCGKRGASVSTYTIHPIVMGTKIFDKGMMTCQHHYGKQYTIEMINQNRKLYRY